MTFCCTSPPSQRLTYLILFLILKYILRYNISKSDLGSLKTILKTVFGRRPIRIKYCEPFRINWRVYIFLGDNLTLLNYNQDLHACCLLHKIKIKIVVSFYGGHCEIHDQKTFKILASTKCNDMNVIKSYLKWNVVKIVVGVLREIGQCHLWFFGWFIRGNRWDDGN